MLLFKLFSLLLSLLLFVNPVIDHSCILRESSVVLKMFNYFGAWGPGDEVELKYFTIPCHTQLPGHQVIDVIPKDGLPMPQCPVVEEVPLKRLIRLINNLINDLSSFPKSLMIWVSLVFESDPGHWSLKFDVLRSVSSLTRVELCNRSYSIPVPPASITLPHYFLQWM